MAKEIVKSYTKIGIIAAAVVAIVGAGVLAIRGFSGGVSLQKAIEDVSTDSVSGADVRIAVIRMDAIQQKAEVLNSLRKQREKYETDLKATLERTQKALENEKSEIEKSQDILSHDALQKKIGEYQQKVSDFQRTLSDKAQAIDAAFQKSLAEIQEKHLDGIVDAIIAKKKLTMVLDGRLVRLSQAAAPALDITDDVVKALDKKITSFRMEKPSGF